MSLSNTDNSSLSSDSGIYEAFDVVVVWSRSNNRDSGVDSHFCLVVRALSPFQDGTNDGTAQMILFSFSSDIGAASSWIGLVNDDDDDLFMVWLEY